MIIAVCAVDAAVGRTPRASTWSGDPRTSTTKLTRYVPRSSIGPPASSSRLIRCSSGEPLAEVRDDCGDLAEHRGVEHLTQHVELRQERRPVRLHAEQPAALGHLGDLAALRRVQGERLLDQGVLAGLQREQRAGQVDVVRGGDIDHVDVRDRRPATRSCRGRARSRMPGERPPHSSVREADGDDLLAGVLDAGGDESSAIQPVPITPQRRLGAERGSGVRAGGSASGNPVTVAAPRSGSQRSCSRAERSAIAMPDTTRTTAWPRCPTA